MPDADSQGSSSGDLSQRDRQGKLTTPLGQDKLVLTRFDGEEGLGDLFEYRVSALSSDEEIDFTTVIGKNCCVEIKSHGDKKRYFNGVLAEAHSVGAEAGFFGYRLILRPWFWLLGRRADCRIFKAMTVTDIIREVFKDAGFYDYDIKSNETYPTMEYCVQYRETDLAFVSRLAEEFGLYGYYDHTEDKHTLLLTDNVNSLPQLSIPNIPPGSRESNSGSLSDGPDQVFRPEGGQARRDVEHIYEWQTERLFRTGVITLNDYDYMKPKANISADAQGSENYDHASFKAYDYPGRYIENEVGQRLAKVRLEAEQSLDHRRSGAGDAVSLYPGVVFSLRDHPVDDGDYFVVRASHTFLSQGYRSSGGGGGGGGGRDAYSGHYELQPKDRPFRSPQVTPKPRVYGPQTAFVVDTDGKDSGGNEEIEVDKDGRILVKFHWMHADQKDCSRRVRVAQMWAGKGWGHQVIPRVGQEVIVEFLEGDPDQPLVVGAVYNADYTYPYTLPDDKTISGVKSDSSKGHGGYNEFNFDDKKTKEKVVFRAEKDLESVVQNTETREIGTNFKTDQGKPSRETTLKHGDENLKTEKGDWNVDIFKNISVEAKGDSITIGIGDSSITLEKTKITITSPEIEIQGTMPTGITIHAPFVYIN